MDVVVTDHHTPRASGELPDAPIVHPSVCGYPCADLCAAGVAHKLAGALYAAAGRDAAEADADLDLVALATVADCVPLRGENRRLVREGLRALAQTRRPGLRALMRIAKVDPGAVDARAIGFRLAPRINAAGRLYRADAGLELMLTTDEARATAIADELDHANAERRAVEQRIRWEAEALLAQAGDQAAYVLAGDDWHPGVIGIVASRIAEQANRPCVLVALDGDAGHRLGPLDPGLRPARRARRRRRPPRSATAGTAPPPAAPCAATRSTRSARRSSRTPSARSTGSTSRPASAWTPWSPATSSASSSPRSSRASRRSASATPRSSLLVPAARLADQRKMGEEGRHVRFSVEAGGHRARAVAFNRSQRAGRRAGRRDVRAGGQRVQRRRGAAAAAALRAARRAGRDRGRRRARRPGRAPRWPSWTRRCRPPTRPRRGGRPRDRRGGGVAGTIAALVAAGEPVLVVCADARRRAQHWPGASAASRWRRWDALERDPALAGRFAHVVALDPPAARRPGRADLRSLHAGLGRARARLRRRRPRRRLGHPPRRGRRVPHAACAAAGWPTRSTPRRRRRPPGARCACSPTSASSPSAAARAPSSSRRAARRPRRVAGPARVRRAWPRPRAAGRLAPAWPARPSGPRDLGYRRWLPSREPTCPGPAPPRTATGASTPSASRSTASSIPSSTRSGRSPPTSPSSSAAAPRPLRDRRGARRRRRAGDRPRPGRARVRLRLRAPRRPAPQVGRGLHRPPGRRREDLRGHAPRHRDAVRRAAARHRRGHDGVASTRSASSSARRSRCSSTASRSSRASPSQSATRRRPRTTAR